MQNIQQKLVHILLGSIESSSPHCLFGSYKVVVYTDFATATDRHNMHNNNKFINRKIHKEIYKELAKAKGISSHSVLGGTKQILSRIMKLRNLIVAKDRESESMLSQKKLNFCSF